MDQLTELLHVVRRYLLILIIIENLIVVGFCWAAVTILKLPMLVSLGASLAVAVGLSATIAILATKRVMQPLTALWQTILHLSPSDHGIAAPDLHKLHLGHDLVDNLAAQIHQLTDVAERSALAAQQATVDLTHNFVAQNLPLPLVTLDNNENITFVNQAFATYIGIDIANLKGKNIYMVLDMAFPNDDTFDKWLKGVKTSSATASGNWERVRMDVRDSHPLLEFDLAAYYNRGNNQHIETMLILFDHTKTYSQDDQAISFIALSVHELRTPLTLLRGYIEVFQDELQGKVEPELLDFMNKMAASAQQLMAFVNNILNVARIDDDQLQLRLQEENWAAILKTSLDTLSLRAGVRGIALEYSVAPDLPSVGVDRLSIYEVINNLVDNAIKYSNGSLIIKIDAHMTQEGMVETTIQDFGAGIPTSVIPNLFTKFYRDHRNRAQIGGTGLGLYLSKAIIAAHGGNLWVRSKEGQGSVFGFTIHPYAQLTAELKQSEDQEIIRAAHGWIKNHSMYRR